VTQATKQFTANQTVTWWINGIQGGNSQVGYVNAAGSYSAPGSVPTPATVQLQAKSAKSSATASITIRYPAPAISSVSPVSIKTGSFTLTVSGTNFHTGAVVKLNGAPVATTFNSSARLTAVGSIAAAAPALPVTVTNPDAQVSNAASITVTNAVSTPVTIAITPAKVNIPAGNTTQFTAAVANTSDKRVTWKVNGVIGGGVSIGTISAAGLYKAPAAMPASVTVSATSVADQTKTAQASVRVIVIPR
jgi:hypothetical protein